MGDKKNYFEVLNGINVTEKTEKKNGLTYLSWAWAWGELKKIHPDATYTIYENADGWFYHTDGKTAWVKTGVTVDGIEHIEYLPVMDYKNKSVPAGQITSFDVNKAIQRSLTKAVARHGLGLYIYAGEDLPEDEREKLPEEERAPEEEKAPEEKSPVTNGDKKITKKDVETLNKMLEGKDAVKTWLLQQFNISSFEEMTNEQYGKALRCINEKYGK